MKTWRLDAGPCSLVLGCVEGQLSLLYLGRYLAPDLDSAELALLRAAITPHGELDVTRRVDAFPTENGIWQEQAAVRARREGHALLIDTVFRKCNAERSGLRIELEDALAGVEIDLLVEGSPAGIFRSRSCLTNTGDSDIHVDWLASLNLPLPDRHQELLRFGGFWANELKSERLALGHYSIAIESHRGRSSHHSFPALLTGEPAFCDARGQVLLAALEWSGNHLLRVGPAAAGGHQLQAGVPLQAGEIVIRPGESYTTPGALFSVAANGMNDLRGQFHRYWQQRKAARTGPRKVHFNSWEASYFKHDEQRIRTLIDDAKALGAERFILDDGWMQGRSGPGCGLGDWLPCPERYPHGLKPVAGYARSQGMGFGLWIEPEMITLDSQLAREHEDWIIQIPDRPLISGRQQFLLNITRDDVREYLYGCLDTLVADCNPDYLKWDMNRDYAQLGFGINPGSVAMTLSWYTLIKEVRARNPGIIIESCAAGGARNDAGAMAIADRLWPSDSMDPLQRFAILRHASLLLPPPRLGTHVGASPSATSAANLPLSTRCIVALLGHMGVELDAAALGTGDRATLTRWLAFYRLHRDWLEYADYYFLSTGEPELEALLLLDESANRGLLFILRSGYPREAQPPILRLPEALRNTHYDLELLNPEDCDFVQRGIAWHNGGSYSVAGETLHVAGLRAPFLRYGHCALVSIQSTSSKATLTRKLPNMEPTSPQETRAADC